MMLQHVILAFVIWSEGHRVVAESLVDPVGVVTSLHDIGTILPRESDTFAENDFPLELPHRDIGPDDDEVLDDPQYDPEPISVTDLWARKLSLASSTIGTFNPLDCNNNLASASCNTKVSANLPSGNNPLIVRCGECYTWDMNDSERTIAGGMNIKGKLQFPPNKKVTIRTPYVIVQGELEIKVNHDIITPANEGVSFIITGADDVMFKATNSPNTGACAQQTGGECNLGPKPFFVAGGRLNIAAFPSSTTCKTHTPILKTITKTPDKNADDFPKYEEFPNTCPQSGSVLIKETFDDSVGNWTGWYGANVHIEDKALKVTNRGDVEQGPTIDISPLKPQMCLEPDKSYLFSVKIKLDRADGSKVGEPTYCKTGSPDNNSWWYNCPRLTIRAGRPGASNKFDTLVHMSNRHGPNYGEWTDWTGVFTFKEEHLWQNTTWTVLQIDRPEAGTDITIDNFKIYLPAASSYPNPNDVCGQLVMNGADFNGINPYPWYRVHSESKLDVVKDEDNNKYLALYQRRDSWSSIEQTLDHNCFDTGVVYEISAKVRLYSEFDERHYWYLEYRFDGSYHRRTILQCSPQKYANGFVSCSGKFTIDQELAEATNVRLRMVMNGDRDKNFDIDFADISIRFSRGYINKLVVSTDDAMCWGEDAEIHVGTSTYYSWNRDEVPNGFTSGIFNVKDKNDGTMEFRLRDPPHIPVISAEDSTIMAAQVALVSRNVKIAGDGDEVADHKGAYLQVLHTPNQVQLISGVRFDNMGRRGDVDRFPIQVLYSGSLQGTEISHNSIHGSHQRCIVLEGTGNVTIAFNVAVDNRGSCIEIGPNASDNKIRRNYVSRTRDISRSLKIPGSRDDHASGFQQYNGPNDYSRNIAVGNEGDGFYFYNDNRLRIENGTVVTSQVLLRGVSMGTFSKNEAIGNAYYGMRFHYHEQQDRITFDQLKVINNREQGFFIHASRRATLKRSFFAGNGYGVEMRWCDEMEISDTVIRGVSEELKALVDPPYYNNPCESRNFRTPMGYRMQTAIHQFDKKFSDGDVSSNRGVSLSNVQFIDFDHDDSCVDSIPIGFNTNDKRDGHWNYVSSFKGGNMFESENMIDALEADDGGVPDIVIIDVDGSSDPANGASGASAFVSDKPHLKAFATKCTSYPHNIAYCEGSCLRTVSLSIDQTGTQFIYVLFTRLDDGASAYGVDFYDYDDDDDAHQLQYEGNERVFSIPLPMGKYKVEFFDGEDLVWPKHVYEKWDGKPECSAHASGTDLTIVEPSIETSKCANLVVNGDMSKGTKFWYHRNNNDDTSQNALVALPKGGRGGTAAIANVNRTRYYHGIGQNIDTRCFHQNENQYYEINVWFRLENNTVPFICDRWESNDALFRCPEVTIKNSVYIDPLTKESLDTDYDHKGYTVMPNNSPDFNLIHGVVKINERYSQVNRAWIYAETAHRSLDYIISDFSFKKIDLACEGNFIRNGDLEQGRSVFWEKYGNGKFNVIDVENTKALEYKEKTRNNYGLRQYLYVNPDCFKEHDRFTVRAKFRLVNSGGTTIECDMASTSGENQCGEVRIETASPLGSRYARVSYAIAVANAEKSGWGQYAGIYTLSEKETNFTKIYLQLSYTDVDTTVIYDDISMEPLPRNCENVVLNDSFEGGDTSYWTISDRRIIHTVVDEGDNNGGEYALSYERGDSDRSDYIYQDLDVRCFEKDQEFEIKAFFKILDDTGTPTTCTKTDKSTSSPAHCPLLYIYATDCADGTVSVELWNKDTDTNWDETIYNEFTFTFPVTDNLATCENVRFGIGRGALQDQTILVASVSFGPLRTFAPTKSPTFQPTEAQTSGPTRSPVVLTDAPTTSLARTCPNVDSPSTQLNAGSVLVGLSAQDTVCAVTMVTMDGNTVVKSIPLARSYNGNDWEVAAGGVGPATFKNGFLCYSQGCQINLPALNPNVRYLLTSHSHSLKRKDEMARFLETATFGATSSEVAELKSDAQSRGNFNAIVDWFTAQSDKRVVSLTSHRKYWRERISPRIPTATKFGSPDHPCDQSSRWRRFAFVRNDVLWWMPRELRIEGNGPYTLYLDGVLRTAVEDFWLTKNETYSFNPSITYQVCRNPDERVLGRLWIELEDGKCVQVENPAVSLADIENKATYVVDLNENNLEEIDVDLTQGEEFVLKTKLSNSMCDDIPAVPEFGDEPVFGKVSDGTWLIFDPRLEVGKNTINSPLTDGGKGVQVASGGASYCSNVRRNFLNEDKCQLSTNACRTTSSNSAVEVVLDNTTISDLNHLVPGRFVYTLKGLNVVDQADDSLFPTKLKHPCTPELRSRWLQKENCNPSELYSGTNASLQELLGKSGDKNPYVRDIYFPEVGMSCNATDTNPEIEIEVKGQCWKRVHGDFMSVYDMTYWVDKHIGGANNIMKWSQNNGTTLIFPNVHPTNKGSSHSMDRWENNKQKFTFVGRVGDFLKIQDLPNELRTENVTKYFDPPDENDSGVLVCGSYGEVENTNTQDGFVFDTSGDDFSTAFYNPGEDKRNVWYMLSLTANDQLRQRVAWALSQILVVVTNAVNDGSRNTEWFLSYYDIFVRNAFGNYRDILREMIYSPLMAENLSFLQSRSSAYIWERYKIKTQADENFAREIMQLFTMGINKLNMDGTLALNDQDETMLAYTNEDIESFARAWTGFDLQPRRSNIEGRDNRLDPMKIQAIWRDRFPKTDSAGGYIGDRFQKCQDLPLKAFLKQGATYRFLGNSPLPELMSDPSEFATVETTKRVILAQSSTLRSFLCNADPNGNCNFQNTVTLPSSISNCGDGPECDLGLIRVVQAASNAYYEYVQEPCVNHAFYPDAKLISPRYSWDTQMCANPALPDAAEACCETFKYRADRNSRYDGERMIFNSAEERCAEIDKTLCDNLDRVNGQRHETSMYFWTPDKCDIMVKVKKNGAISIVHQTTDSGNVVSHVDESNENFFRVLWTKNNAWPKAKENCGDCKVVSGDQCLCNAFVREHQVFSDDAPPASVEDALFSLSIGAPNPNIYAASSFTVVTDPNTGITTYLKNGNINKNTVFELTDDKGRHFFLKNLRENVYVNGLTGQYTGFYFRNPPHFMSLVPSETALRDAQYETEATLDHYFYHDNTAPFLTSRLIQRLTASNPSPRYVLTAATAFKEGRYTADNGNVFGDGIYGDLKAVFAAIYLDREARSVVLDSDPSQGSLREPIIKLLSVLRSMEFKSNSPVLRFRSLLTKIGQDNHSFESVFSFFLPEFKPYGRVGEASLTAPEATLLDMPRIVGILNGLQSLVKHGLCNRDGGFGQSSCSGKTYQPSPSGVLEYGKNDPNFTGETFEGLSLIGGLDNTWVGRDYSLFTANGEVVGDPTSQTNHVYHPLYDSRGRFFSPSVSNVGNTVVKFQYYATVDNAGGCIGYTTDYDRLLSQEWMYCDAPPTYAENEMTAEEIWVTCQFVIPNAVSDFRIVVGDRIRSGDSYFDNITTGTGTETTCTGVDIGTLNMRGEIGFSEKVVNELATLLTAGRLSTEHREIIRGAYDKALNADDGLKLAQQLILTTAEFHTTNFVKSEDKIRPSVTFPPPSNKPYRAVVYMMFSGGCDSFNMLTPYECERKDMYQEYKDVRQQVALTLQDLLPVQASDQVCEKFGVHADLGAVHGLYNDEDLIFFANTGVMSRPVTKKNYNLLTQTQLFAHNHMQREAKRVDPYDTNSGTGVLGRVADVLTKNGNNVGSFSVDRYSIALIGKPGMSDAPMIVNRNGVPDKYLDDISDYIPNLHKETTADSGYFGETWSASLIEGLSTNDVLSAELKNVEVGTAFPNSYLARQLETVARLIATRESRGVDTDVFYVETGGFDTHSNVEENLSARFIGVNEGIEAFAAELKRLRVWNNVTTIQTSDFARTLNPNGGDGTDHAWGGNYMMFGGSVKGGQILGEYPDNLTDEGPLTLNRGRMIPSTPWDAVFKGIAGWLGVPNSEMNDVLPNLKNFESFFFTTDDMFGDVLPQPPTSTPTQSPKTAAPTDSPTKATVPTASPTKKTDAPTNATSKPTKSPSTPNVPTASPTAFPTGAAICFDDDTLALEGDSTKNCAWVRKKAAKLEQRCFKYDSITKKYAFEHCRETCGRCSCDNKNWMFKGVPKKNCNWVGQKPGVRCGKPGATENCKSACGQPCCKDDPLYLMGDNAKRSCEWLSSNPTTRCPKLNVNNYMCPETCGKCTFN